MKSAYARPQSEEPLLLRPEEAAQLLSLGRTKVYELVRSGRLGSVKVGKRRLIPRKALEQFVEGLTV